MNADMSFNLPYFFWGTVNPGEHISLMLMLLSDIYLGEQISLGKCVRGYAFPGGTHITITPASHQNGQIVYLLTFFLLSFLLHNSMITAEGITTTQTQTAAQITGYCTHYLS